MSFYLRDGHFSKIYTPEELSEAVELSLKYYQDQAEYWKEKYKLWHKKGMEQANAELMDRIKALQEKLDMSYGEFASIKEKQAYIDFEQRHIHERLTSKIQGGKAPYLIPTGTGIGTILHVRCPICGAEENITDTEMW